MVVFMDKRIRWLKEPLVHFLAIGALVFLVFHMWGSGGPGNNRIVITSGQIDSMIARFTPCQPVHDRVCGLR